MALRGFATNFLDMFQSKFIFGFLILNFVIIFRYITKNQFEEIGHLLSEEKFLLASDCVEESKDDPSMIRLFASLGADDFEEEGSA